MSDEVKIEGFAIDRLSGDPVIVVSGKGASGEDFATTWSLEDLAYRAKKFPSAVRLLEAMEEFLSGDPEKIKSLPVIVTGKEYMEKYVNKTAPVVDVVPSQLETWMKDAENSAMPMVLRSALTKRAFNEALGKLENPDPKDPDLQTAYKIPNWAEGQFRKLANESIEAGNVAQAQQFLEFVKVAEMAESKFPAPAASAAAQTQKLPQPK